MNPLVNYEDSDASQSESDDEDVKEMKRSTVYSEKKPLHLSQPIPHNEGNVATPDTVPNLIKKEDFFALNESDSSEDDDEMHSVLNVGPEHHVSKAVSCTSLDDSFWNPKLSEVVSWDDPTKIWSCGQNPQQQEVKAHLENSGNASQCKKRSWETKCQMSQKRLRKEKEQPGDAVPPKPMSKPGYFIHHKVAPFLHQTASCNCPRSPISKIQDHIGTVSSVAWCSKQEFSHLLLSSSLDKTVKVFNIFAKDGMCCVQALSAHSKGVQSAVWAEGGRKVITASFDKTARLFDIETGKQLSCFRHDGFVSAVRLHPVCENYFLTGSKNCVLCWDTRSGDKSMRSFTYKDTFGQVEDIALMNNGTLFFTCNDSVTRDSADRNIMAWDFNKAVVVSNQIYQERYTCTKLTIHPDQSQFIAQTNGDYIASFSTIRPYKMNRYKRFGDHKVQGNKVGCDFSPDGIKIVSGSADGSVYFYDLHTAKVTRKIPVCRGAVLPVAWHSVLPSVVACGSEDGSITVLQ